MDYDICVRRMDAFIKNSIFYSLGLESRIFYSDPKEVCLVY